MKYVILLSSVLCAFVCPGQNLKSGRKLSPDQAIMDIRHYTISLTVGPDQKSIDGYTEIDLILSVPTDRLVFDLTNVLKVNKVWVNGKEAKQEHAENKLFISSAWLWPLIITVLIVLGFITYRLTKEMDKGSG